MSNYSLSMHHLHKNYVLSNRQFKSKYLPFLEEDEDEDIEDLTIEEKMNL